MNVVDSTESTARRTLESVLRLYTKIDFHHHEICLAGNTSARIFSNTSRLLRKVSSAFPKPHSRDFSLSRSCRSADIFCWEGRSADIVPHALSTSISKLGAKGELPDGDSEEFRITYNAGSRVLSIWDHCRNRGFFWTPEANILPTWEYAAPLRSLMHWIHQESGSQLTHAAVVGAASAGIMLAGAGGSGKSSTAVSCVKAGFDYIGDDYVVVHPGDTPHASCLYQTAKLAPSFLNKHFTHMAKDSVVCGEMKKVVTRLDQYVSTAPTRIAAIVLPEVTGQPHATISKASAADALRSLVPTTTFQLPYGSKKALHTLGQLCRQLPCYRLRLSIDPSENVKCVRRILGEHL